MHWVADWLKRDVCVCMQAYVCIDTVNFAMSSFIRSVLSIYYYL